MTRIQEFMLYTCFGTLTGIVVSEIIIHIVSFVIRTSKMIIKKVKRSKGANKTVD